MIKARTENNEVISSGKVLENDIYSGFCCEGFDWEVVLPPPLEIFGVCQNQDCPGNASPTGWYQGVSVIGQEELELWLAERNE